MLSDGRTLRFRGAADRVDRAADGMLWVFDYKTGKPSGIDPADPTVGGHPTPAARLRTCSTRRVRRRRHAQVGAAYWFVSTRGEFKWVELELTDAVEARVDVVLRAIVDGIEHGVFPCRLDPPTRGTPRGARSRTPTGAARATATAMGAQARAPSSRRTWRSPSPTPSTTPMPDVAGMTQIELDLDGDGELDADEAARAAIVERP